MNQALWVISSLYGVMGILYAFIGIRRIVRRNEIEIFDFVRLMYAFVYGVIPCLIYGQESSGQRNLYFFDYSAEGIQNIAVMLCLSIVAYGLLNLAYFSVPKNQNGPMDDQVMRMDDKPLISRNLIIMGLISLLIGGVSLFLWTKAYGSLSKFIENASMIRSGKGKVHNSFAFMKQFVRILPLSLYAFLSAYCIEKPRKWKRLELLILIGISIVANYLYFMASDSRVTILFTGLAMVAIMLKHRKGNNISRYLLLAGIISFVLLESTMLADTFTRYIRYGVWVENTDGLISNLTREFRFILSADMKVMKAWSEGILHKKIFDDLLNALTSWIPERFVPFEIPETIWRYNTAIYPTSGSGTSPSALVSTGIYEIGILGAFVQPFILGLATAYADKKMKNSNARIYGDVYYGVCVGVFIQMVSHNQISTFVGSLFPAFLFFVLTKILSKVSFRGKTVL